MASCRVTAGRVGSRESRDRVDDRQRRSRTAHNSHDLPLLPTPPLPLSLLALFLYGFRRMPRTALPSSLMSDAPIARVTRVGGDDDVSWDLPEGSSLVVGSDDACHINVPADATDVSGRHVMISCARGYGDRAGRSPPPGAPLSRMRARARDHARTNHEHPSRRAFQRALPPPRSLCPAVHTSTSYCPRCGRRRRDMPNIYYEVISNDTSNPRFHHLHHPPPRPPRTTPNHQTANL